jgi:rhodanese-related sulfurtransferase
VNNTTRTEATRMTVHDAMGRLERGENLVFLDARSPAAWGESNVRLPGAIRVPADEVTSHLNEIPREATVISYCT